MRVLRRADDVAVGHRPGLFSHRGWLTLQVGRSSYTVGSERIHRSEYAALEESQWSRPLPLAKIGPRRYWWFRDLCYWETEGLSQKQVYTLLVSSPSRTARPS